MASCFTVELLKKKYGITNEQEKKSFLTAISEFVKRDRGKERAIEYLMQWGEEFWQPSEYRVKEITNRMERDLKGSISGGFPPVEFSTSGASHLTSEQKAELVHRGQNIINQVQLKELTDIFKLLNEDIFRDPQEHFYICVDKLDDPWVDDRFRYRLIRSLIDSVREFQSVKNVKIIAAIRSDLLDRVFRNTRDSGYQEEKYRTSYLDLKWDANQLKEMLDLRVKELVRESYTTHSVGYDELMPFKLGGVKSYRLSSWPNASKA